MKSSSAASPPGPSSSFAKSRTLSGSNNGNTIKAVDKKQRAQEYDNIRELRKAIADLEEKFNKMERRVAKIENNFIFAESEIKDGVCVDAQEKGIGSGGGGILKYVVSKFQAIEHLESRLEVLEEAVENEHQSSLQMLDVLLDTQTVNRSFSGPQSPVSSPKRKINKTKLISR